VVVGEAARAFESARTARDHELLPVAVGATPATSASIVPVALGRLEERLGRLPWTLMPALTRDLELMVADGEVDVAVVTDAPPGLTADPRLERRRLGTDEMYVMVPVGHPAASTTRTGIDTFANEPWVEDNDGSAALLRASAGRAGFDARIERSAADLMGKMALVAAGHAVALFPGVLAPSLRSDVVPVTLDDPPRRGIYALTKPASRPHPALGPLIDELTRALDEITAS
jgi:DNA-binding transcriptional LysR family regulator